MLTRPVAGARGGGLGTCRCRPGPGLGSGPGSSIESQRTKKEPTLAVKREESKRLSTPYLVTTYSRRILLPPSRPPPTTTATVSSPRHPHHRPTRDGVDVKVHLPGRTRHPAFTARSLSRLVPCSLAIIHAHPAQPTRAPRRSLPDFKAPLNSNAYRRHTAPTALAVFLLEV